MIKFKNLIPQLNTNRHFYIGDKKIGRLHIENKGYHGAFEFRLDFGHGAGGRGWTFFVAGNCYRPADHPSLSNRKRVPLQIGFTRYCGKIPLADGCYSMVRHAYNFGPYGGTKGGAA